MGLDNFLKSRVQVRRSMVTKKLLKIFLFIFYILLNIFFYIMVKTYINKFKSIFIYIIIMFIQPQF